MPVPLIQPTNKTRITNTHKVINTHQNVWVIYRVCLMQHLISTFFERQSCIKYGKCILYTSCIMTHRVSMQLSVYFIK